ncbi:MAG TPA: YifB family Mg chelatase-like AAA ATPase [Candidatus Obscuribacterales bacterium]
MFARVYSGALSGVDAYRVEVEVDYCGGIGQILIVGLPDTAIKESQERVRSAIKACDFILPPCKKWVINLAPADTRKEGPSFDLPIAVAVLSASGYVPCQRLSEFWMVGELGLDGSVRGTTGVLPVAISARAEGFASVIVPEPNAQEAALIDGLTVYPVSHLKQVVDILCDPDRCPRLRSQARSTYQRLQTTQNFPLDFGEVKGQTFAKRGLLIAAAGRHNVLMVGPPGAGKSMLAQRLPGIMPPLEFDEALELTKLYSVAGLTTRGGIICDRPFRAPHHSASMSGLLGGGSWPRPGEISLSHHGVLFLDELTEFPRHHVDAFRQPLESGCVTISRANQTLSYPAQFLMVGACNPCPCGYKGDLVKYCRCTSYQAEKYWSKLSGPFLDRIDLQIEMTRISEVDLVKTNMTMESDEMRLLVARAVKRQRGRFGEGEPFCYNGQLSQQHLHRFCRVSDACRDMLARAISTLGLSARAYDRILRIARTIADLDDARDIDSKHLGEAIRYRAPVSEVLSGVTK